MCNGMQVRGDGGDVLPQEDPLPILSPSLFLKMAFNVGAGCRRFLRQICHTKAFDGIHTQDKNRLWRYSRAGCTLCGAPC
jgi:hypothetical protein